MSLYYYLYGTFQIANLFLAVVAGTMAATMFQISHQRSHLRPWKVLILALILFAVLEIVGALRSFGVITPTQSLFFYGTHLITSGIIALLIVTLIMQNRIAEE